MATKKVEARLQRKRRVRKKIRGSAERPRLSVFRSLKHIYAQVIDDDAGVTIAAASTVEKVIEGKDKTERAWQVGEAVAKRCAEKGVKAVVFDRGGYLYHGRVKAVAEGARKAGLEF